GLAAVATPILLDQLGVRELGLGILVEKPHVRMRRCRVEVVVVLLHVLAVVPLVAGEAEEPFLQNRIAAVPEREREADVLMAIAQAGEAILAPAVGARARVIVREVLPGVAGRAVVFAHGAPGALADVGPPPLPVNFARVRLAQALLFGGLAQC